MLLPVIVLFFATLALAAATTRSPGKQSETTPSASRSHATEDPATEHPPAATPSEDKPSVGDSPAGKSSAVKPLATAPQAPERRTLFEAAIALGEALERLHVEHAVIGGVACNLLGSERRTQDLDLVVSVPGTEVRSLKARVASVDNRFEQVGTGIRFKGHTFGIELLPTDMFLWPTPLSSATVSITPTEVPGSVNVLSPAAVFFAKAKRVRPVMSSDRPKTMAKVNGDIFDMTFLHSITPADTFRKIFDLYPADKQGSILEAVKVVGQTYTNLADVEGFIHPS